MPNFLVEESTVRNSGESPVLALEAGTRRHLLLKLTVSHVVERQNLDVDVLASQDGVDWTSVPAASFLQKFCCGTYEIILPNCEARFLKAAWRVGRWGSGDHRPLCRFCLSVQEVFQVPLVRRAMAGAA